MPEHSPADPMAAMQQVKSIPVGGRIKITDRVDKDGSPWYGVSAYGQQGKEVGTGWINSTALVGQKLEGYRD